MTRREAAIVTAFTGHLVGDFSDVHDYAEQVLGRHVWMHEFGLREFKNELREKTRADFVGLRIDGDNPARPEGWGRDGNAVD